MFELLTDVAYLELLGERLKAYRLNKNISQQELADFCGVSRRTIVLLENGKGVHLLTFIRVLRKFDLDNSLIDLIPDVNEIDPFKINLRTKKRERAS